MSQSSTPLMIFIVMLIIAIASLLAYFFMFYEPSEEVCSKLHKSNICTSTYCTDTFPCPDQAPPTWRPSITTSSDSILGHKINLPTDDIGTLYTSELSTLSDVFKSNVCTELKKLANAPTGSSTKYGFDAGGPGADNPATYKCMNLIGDIDSEIDKAKTDFEKSRLFSLRKAVIDKCNTAAPPTGDSTIPKGITIASAATISLADFGEKGSVSNIFCT